MGRGLLSPALLFVGSLVFSSEHYSVSERSRRGPPEGQASGPGWPEAAHGRLRPRKGLQAQKKEGRAAEGSICSFLALDGLPAFSLLL